MSSIVSRIFAVEKKSENKRPNGNSVAIVCGIVSIITCCFSCNLAYTRYEEARSQYIRACRLIEKSSPDFLKQAGEIKEATPDNGQPDPFI